jgi:hypothetical protein
VCERLEEREEERRGTDSPELTLRDDTTQHKFFL